MYNQLITCWHCLQCQPTIENHAVYGRSVQNFFWMLSRHNGLIYLHHDMIEVNVNCPDWKNKKFFLTLQFNCNTIQFCSWPQDILIFINWKKMLLIDTDGTVRLKSWLWLNNLPYDNLLCCQKIIYSFYCFLTITIIISLLVHNCYYLLFDKDVDLLVEK